MKDTTDKMFWDGILSKPFTREDFETGRDNILNGRSFPHVFIDELVHPPISLIQEESMTTSPLHERYAALFLNLAILYKQIEKDIYSQNFRDLEYIKTIILNKVRQWLSLQVENRLLNMYAENHLSLELNIRDQYHTGHYTYTILAGNNEIATHELPRFIVECLYRGM